MKGQIQAVVIMIITMIFCNDYTAIKRKEKQSYSSDSPNRYTVFENFKVDRRKPQKIFKIQTTIHCCILLFKLMLVLTTHRL